MARKKLLRVGVLNISTHPHPPGTYQRIFERAFTTRTVFNYWGSYWGMVGTFSQLDSNNDNIFVGEIYRFTNINTESPWINLKKNEEADAKDLAAVNLPPHLRPEFHSASFLLFAKEHRLVFDAAKLSHNSAQRLLHGLLNSEGVSPRMREVEVTIEQEKKTLTRIYGMNRLRKLEIVISRPNEDDISKYRGRFMKRLENENVRRVTEIQEAQKGESIEPDNETKLKAQVALSNGHVTAAGYDNDGHSTTISTKDFPLLDSVEYDPDATSLIRTLLYLAERLVKRLTK